MSNMGRDNWDDFVRFHVPVLEQDEVHNGVLIDLLVHGHQIDHWCFGEAGHCAVGSYQGIVLGNLTQKEARLVAELAPPEYRGVIGPELTAHWFANRATELGIQFGEVEAQQIYKIDTPVQFPKIEGNSVFPKKGDISEYRIVKDWLTAFYKEANPYAPLYDPWSLNRAIKEQRYLMWECDGMFVAMGGIVRKLKKTAAITSIYTPPEYRGHGFGSAITAELTNMIQAMGLTPTLYTDLQVPSSNRCYARLGYKPAYASFHFHR